MSSPCRCAVAITGSCTRPAMNGHGGTAGGLMRSRSREAFGKKRMPRQNKRRQCDAAAPTLPDLQTKLDSVRRQVRNLTVMSMDPNQPPDQARLIKQLEQSARAETRLRSMALAHGKDRLRRRFSHFTKM